MFYTVGDAITYEPFFRMYHRLAFEEFYNDGVMYIELRSSYGQVNYIVTAIIILIKIIKKLVFTT